MGMATRPTTSKVTIRCSCIEQMAATLDAMLAEIRRIQGRAREGERAERSRWPMLILRTPKGWTGPKVVDGKPVEGTWRSHQVPISELARQTGSPEDPRRLDEELSRRINSSIPTAGSSPSWRLLPRKVAGAWA